MEIIDYLGQRIHKWEIGASTFLAFPERGARLMNWNLTMADGNVRDVIYWPSVDSLEDLTHVRGGNPILFPFCGKCFDNGKEGYWVHEKKQLPMPGHGFARNGSFRLIDSTRNGFAAVLEPTQADFESYPFKYHFVVIYRFEQLSFHVELRMENLDTKPIPWAAGHHFFFHLPWNSNAAREDYRIDIPAKKAFYHLDDGKLSPVKGFQQKMDMSDTELVDRIHTRLTKNKVVFGPKSGEEDIAVILGMKPVPPTDAAVVTWTESNESPYYCVEPWMAAPNCPEHRKGMHFVDPGKSEAWSCEVSLV